MATSLALKLISLLSPVGWLGQLVKGIYDGIMFIIRNFGKITDFFTKIKAVYTAVIGGIPVAQIATSVESALAGFVVPVLDAIATLIGIPNLPDKIREVFKTVKDFAQKPVKALLNAIAAPLKAVFDALLNKLGLGEEQPLLDPVTLDKDGKQKLYVTSDGTVWLQASPKKNVVKCLIEAKKSASGMQQMAIDEALTKAQQLSKDAKTVAEDTKTVQKMAGAKKTAMTTMTAKQEEKDLKDKLNKLQCACGLSGSSTGMCFVGETFSLGWGWLRNESLGRRAWTMPGAKAGPMPDPSTLRLVRLTLDYGGGDGVDAALLRRVEELAARAVVEGGLYHLDMPEMGAVGWARVRSVEPCPKLEEGAGSLVTGWFHHWRGVVYDLWVQGESKPIGVTARHPFWSVDRQAWVPLVELEPGERVQAWNGSSPVVESLSLRAEPEPVYNIEVEGDHCYRVGEQGLLVHNASVGCVNNRKGFIDYGSFDNVIDPESSEGSQTNSMYTYFGRPTGIHAFLTPSMLGTGTAANKSLIPPGWSELPSTNRARGHLLGNQLGGSGDNPLNIVALIQNNANDPAMKTCENRVADALGCQCVEIWVTPTYKQGQYFPNQIKIAAKGDRGFSLSVTISNTVNVTVPKMCMKT